MIEIFILSIIQGVTEFLPVSSSSHLIIISEYLDFENQSLSIDVSLHIGSFIAVITYFREEILNFVKNKMLFFKVFVSSIPVMLFGFLLIKFELIDQLRNLQVIGWTTILFGILLYMSDKFNIEKNLDKKMSEIIKEIPKTFQTPTMAPYCKDEDKYALVDKIVKDIETLKNEKVKIDDQEIEEILTVNGVRFTFKDGSWGLIRASSNKPSLVIVTESPTSDNRKLKIFRFIDSLLQKTGKIGEYDQKI